jgi:peroxiredoxin
VPSTARRPSCTRPSAAGCSLDGIAGDDLLSLPPDLPVPEDDGAADHLRGAALPSVALPATDGSRVDLSAVTGRAVVFAYPRTGTPGDTGGPEWDAIPGARGCTPEACAIRDDHARFVALGVTVFGLSAQSPAEQHEAAERLHLPYLLLSDADGALREALRLPAFEWRGRTLLKRATLLLDAGRIADVIYPVFPPDRAAATALRRLQPA